MRIVFDLDGVICPLKEPDQKYADLAPNPGVVKIIRDLKVGGHYIIINTARHMRTCGGDVEKVIAKIGGATTEWLKRHDVPFDELLFGKPYADIYIDDMNVVYSTPERLKNDIRSLMPNFVIPMAGKGERFAKAGYKTPKYMVKAGPESLFEWALKGIPLDLANKLVFICLQEHEAKYGVSKFIKKAISTHYHFLNDKYEIIFIKKLTRGQAETVLAAKKHINNSTPLVIYNIDSYFRSSRLRQRLISARNQKIDGIWGGFNGSDPKLSFAKINKKGFVTRTAEKKPISNIASTGLYIFTEGKDFVGAAEYAIKNNIKTNGEFYIAPLYNILIKQKKKYIIDTAEEFWSLGTPEDMDCFAKNYLKEGEK